MTQRAANKIIAGLNDAIAFSRGDVTKAKVHTPSFAARSEASIQRDIVAYLRAVLMPTHKVLAIPNGARRTANGYAANAVAGITKGAPDLLIAGKGQCWFIEVKRARGTLSQDQQCFREWCITPGNTPFAVCRSVDDARAALEHWGIETREAKK